MKIHFLAKTLSIAALIQCVVFLAPVQAQSVDCKTIIVLRPLPGKQSLTAILTKLSFALNVSVISEIFRTEDIVLIPQDTVSFEYALSLFGPELECENIGPVIHIYERGVISLADNKLAFKFSTFEIPDTVGRFGLDLRERLRTEPWTKEGKRTFVQRGSGFLPPDYRNFVLRNETLSDVTARQVLFHVALEQKILCIIEFLPKSANLSGQKAWEFADAHWYLEVLTPGVAASD